MTVFLIIHSFISWNFCSSKQLRGVSFLLLSCCINTRHFFSALWLVAKRIFALETICVQCGTGDAACMCIPALCVRSVRTETVIFIFKESNERRIQYFWHVAFFFQFSSIRKRLRKRKCCVVRSTMKFKIQSNWCKSQRNIKTNILLILSRTDRHSNHENAQFPLPTFGWKE